MSDKSDAVDAFKIICPPKDEIALDREWLEMCGFFVKGWLAKSAQQHAHLTPESLASAQAVVNASALEQLDSVPPPTQAQVA